MNILLFGDVVGKPGRAALKIAVPLLREKHHADLVIANVENLAHGFGVTPETLLELKECGVDVFTSGNHIWKNHKGVEFLKTNPENVLRPANYDAALPGRGFTTLEFAGTRVCIINLLGSVFMKDEVVASPFHVVDGIITKEGNGAIVIVDFHAEATGEKRAMSWHLDGRASVLVGTHTHVQTSDEQILPQGLGYITDLGMCGATDSSLGMDKMLVLQKNVEQLDVSLEPPIQPHEVVASGVMITVDVLTRRATHIERIDHRMTL